jgi:hypothetical protein
MTFIRKYGLAGFALFLFLSGCDDTQPFPDTPEISFVSMSTSEIKQLDGEVKIVFHYQDGDGDLGNDGSGVGEASKTIFVTDPRVIMPDSDAVSSYEIPNLTPDARKPSIQGEMEVSIPAPFHCTFLGGAASCTDNVVIFEIYIRDRAGNVSNVIQTDPLTILP